MTSILTRQLSIGTSSKAAPQGEVTLYKSWSLPFKRARNGGEAILVLLLESAEPKGSRLLGQVYEALRKAFGRESIERSIVKERMDSAIQAANELVLREMANTSASSTQRISVLLAAFLPAEDAGCEVVIAHVGACRAFLRSRQQITPLTLPHTWGQENVKNGSLKAEEEVNESQYPYWRHPTRALGVAQKVAVDFTLTAGGAGAPTDCVTLARGDTMLLCSSRLTATALKKQNPRIDARSVSALAQQLTERAALPGGNGAAAVAVGWSNNLALVAMGAIVAMLVVLAFVPWGIFGFGASQRPSETTTATESEIIIPTETTLSPTVTSVPTETAPSTPTSTPPPPVAIAAAPTRTAQPMRAPTTTPIPTPTATAVPPTLTAAPVLTLLPATTFVADSVQDTSGIIDMSEIDYTAFTPNIEGEDSVTNLILLWSSSGALPDPYALEVIAWLPDVEGNPDTDLGCFLDGGCGRGIASPTKDTRVKVDLEMLSRDPKLRGFIMSGRRYNWTVFVIIPETGATAYKRIGPVLRVANGDYPEFEFRSRGASSGSREDSTPVATPTCEPGKNCP